MNCSIREGGWEKGWKIGWEKRLHRLNAHVLVAGCVFHLLAKIDGEKREGRGEKEKRPEGKTIQSESTQEKAQQQYIWGKLHPVSHKSVQKANLQIIRI